MKSRIIAKPISETQITELNCLRVSVREAIECWVLYERFRPKFVDLDEPFTIEDFQDLSSADSEELFQRSLLELNQAGLGFLHCFSRNFALWWEIDLNPNDPHFDFYVDVLLDDERRPIFEGCDEQYRYECSSNPVVAMSSLLDVFAEFHREHSPMAGVRVTFEEDVEEDFTDAWGNED